MRILVTGAGGQLGTELVRFQDSRHELIGLARAALDITDLAQCREALDRIKPDCVIHCAAYTAVDRAEDEPGQAFAVNHLGTRNLALAAQETGAQLCYISTDYVFDGQGNRPYQESDAVNPQTVYGQSKQAGEAEVASLLDRYYIVRTSWVFGRYGPNFVKTMLRLAREGKPLRVVDDQVGSPTYTYDLARFLLELVQSDRYGIYHATNSGTCSWHAFAEAIFEESGLAAQLSPCSSAEFASKAKRPAYSVLGHEAIRANGFTDLPPWRDALIRMLQDEES